MAVRNQVQLTSGPEHAPRVADKLVSYIKFHAYTSVERGVGYDDIELTIGYCRRAVRQKHFGVRSPVGCQSAPGGLDRSNICIYEDYVP